MNMTLNDAEKTTEIPQNSPSDRRDSIDTAETAVDIEHVPVQDDPRSWSWLRKVIVETRLLPRMLSTQIDPNVLAFQFVSDIGGRNDCWFRRYDSEP